MKFINPPGEGPGCVSAPSGKSSSLHFSLLSPLSSLLSPPYVKYSCETTCNLRATRIYIHPIPFYTWLINRCQLHNKGKVGEGYCSDAH